jgi:hypothetical protein
MKNRPQIEWFLDTTTVGCAHSYVAPKAFLRGRWLLLPRIACKFPIEISTSIFSWLWDSVFLYDHASSMPTRAYLESVMESTQKRGIRTLRRSG